MSSAPRICATIEARMTSSRLPGKVLMEAAGKPLLAHMIERLQRAKSLDGIVVCTTVNATDDPVEELAARMGVMCHRGSEDDVLQRVLDGAERFGLDVIVQMTGDCPLCDPAVVDAVAARFLAGGTDYVSTTLTPGYPVGIDATAFKTATLREVAGLTDDPDDHEHVSLYIYRHPERYVITPFQAPPELSDPDLHLTLDWPEDYDLIGRIFNRLYPVKPDFGTADILALLRENPDWRRINAHVRRTVV